VIYSLIIIKSKFSQAESNEFTLEMFEKTNAHTEVPAVTPLPSLLHV